jgi:hypothetical protein
MTDLQLLITCPDYIAKLSASIRSQSFEIYPSSIVAFSCAAFFHFARRARATTFE